MKTSYTYGIELVPLLTAFFKVLILNGSLLSKSKGIFILKFLSIMGFLSGYACLSYVEDPSCHFNH